MLQVFFKFPFDVRVQFAASLILLSREGEMAEAGSRRWEERRGPKEDSSHSAELRDTKLIKLLSRKGDG